MLNQQMQQAVNATISTQEQQVAPAAQVEQPVEQPVVEQPQAQQPQEVQYQEQPQVQSFNPNWDVPQYQPQQQEYVQPQVEMPATDIPNTIVPEQEATTAPKDQPAYARDQNLAELESLIRWSNQPKEEEPAPEEAGEEEDVNIEDFDEDEFDNEFGESLKSRFSNVKSYITESIENRDGKLFIEGVITFNSGSKKATHFELRPKTITNEGVVKFLARNKELKETYMVAGKVHEKKLITESMKIVKKKGATKWDYQQLILL